MKVARTGAAAPSEAVTVTGWARAAASAATVPSTRPSAYRRPGGSPATSTDTASPSGSLTAMANGVIRSPCRYVRSPGAVISGGRFAAGVGSDSVTLTSTVSVSLSPPAVTVSVNVSVTSDVRPDGAVKPGVAVSLPVSVTAGLPPVWLHDQPRVTPDGPVEPLPSRFTPSPSVTVWPGPASAVSSDRGGVKTGPTHSTVTSTVSVSVTLLSPE